MTAPSLLWRRLDAPGHDAARLFHRDGHWLLDGAATYHYESAGGAFVRELEVSEAGLVTRYPGLWQADAGA